MRPDIAIAWAVLVVATTVLVICSWKLARVTAQDTVDRAAEDQLDQDFQWWIGATRSPIMAERMAARQVLADSFDYSIPAR
jgi:hypothetical protein